MPSNKVRAFEIGRRLNGISILGFGANWNVPESEREIVRAFIIFLEDRRALYAPTQVEVEGDVRYSVEAIRNKATEVLNELPESSQAALPIRAIRAAARRYATSSQQRYPNILGLGPRAEHAAAWLVALGELRAAIGLSVGHLAFALDIDVEEELASIIPSGLGDNPT